MQIVRLLKMSPEYAWKDLARIQFPREMKGLKNDAARERVHRAVFGPRARSAPVRIYQMVIRTHSEERQPIQAAGQIRPVQRNRSGSHYCQRFHSPYTY